MTRTRTSTWLASTVAIAAAMAVGAATLTPGALSAHPQPEHRRSQVSVTYTADQSVIANPARGFYHVAETHYRDAKGAGWTPMDGAELRSWRAEGITQVLREVYLENFGGADGVYNLSPDLLRKINADFATARRAGVKVILRFAYTLPPDGVWPPPTPYGDAPVARVLHHIRQLGPVLRRNADVIETVQQGFIGLWGEGYYSDYFSDPADPSIVTDQNWADRAKVLRTLLDQLPKSVTVQERTMYMKQRILGVPTGAAGALTPAQAFSGSDLSRVGFHNDCFLASPDDYGTFLSDPLSLDEKYLALDSRYVPVGGETCNVNPPKSEWPSARSLMERFHYSYLNTEYNQDVLDTWGAAGYQEAAKRLGYRFTLLHGTFSKQVVAGRKLHVDLSVQNDGFATPFQKRPVQLVLVGTKHTYRLALDADPRRWTAGRVSEVHADVVVPKRLASGSYRLAVALPDPAPSLRHRVDYAIRLADVGTWNAAEGWNELGATVEVHSHR
jgi:Domain of unknown function (DUF4832)/Domain of unknown function (DUF4874)